MSEYTNVIEDAEMEVMYDEETEAHRMMIKAGGTTHLMEYNPNPSNPVPENAKEIPSFGEQVKEFVEY